jgi:hypothetical protein
MLGHAPSNAGMRPWCINCCAGDPPGVQTSEMPCSMYLIIFTCPLSSRNVLAALLAFLCAASTRFSKSSRGCPRFEHAGGTSATMISTINQKGDKVFIMI